MNQVLNSIARVTGRFYARHYNVKHIRKILELIRSFTFSANNVDFYMDRNGESWLLKMVSSIGIKVIFDVGANKGDYLITVLNHIPNAEIHAFEILPENFHLLLKLKLNKNIFLNDYGLSDYIGDLLIWFDSNAICDESATAYPNLSIIAHKDRYNTCVQCKVKTGLNYIIEKKIYKIDLLKIDVEGGELKVIKGFGNYIKEVRLIQFEFGIFNIVSRDLLKDFFDYLNEYEFIIGRLFPKGVSFFTYNFTRESFEGGNYVAINKNDFELKKMLSF